MKLKSIKIFIPNAPGSLILGDVPAYMEMVTAVLRGD